MTYTLPVYSVIILFLAPIGLGLWMQIRRERDRLYWFSMLFAFSTILAEANLLLVSSVAGRIIIVISILWCLVLMLMIDIVHRNCAQNARYLVYLILGNVLFVAIGIGGHVWHIQPWICCN